MKTPKKAMAGSRYSQPFQLLFSMHSLLSQILSLYILSLILSGLPTRRFAFEGFLSVNKLSRKEHLDELKQEKRTMVFYEAPHKLQTTLKDMLAVFGDREIALVKELTKIHENVFYNNHKWRFG